MVFSTPVCSDYPRCCLNRCSALGAYNHLDYGGVRAGPKWSQHLTKLAQRKKYGGNGIISNCEAEVQLFTLLDLFV